MESEIIIDRTKLRKEKSKSNDVFDVNVKGQDIQMSIMGIDSVMAKKLLESNIKNRPLSNRNIHFLKTQMQKGMWKFDAEPLRFSEDGELLDGQHRLSALKELPNVTLPFLVVTNLPKDVFKVMDTGKKRSAGDTFGIENIANSNLASTTVKLIHSIESGSLRVGRTAMQGGLSNTEALEYYRGMKGIDGYIRDAKKLNSGRSKLITDSTAGAFYYLFAKKNEEQAVEFMTKLLKGTYLEENSPIKALRDRLIRAQSKYTQSLTFTDKNILMIIGWNKYRADEKISFIKMPKNNDNLTIQ